MICRPNNRPEVTQDLEAMICWMDSEASLTPRDDLHAEAHDPHGAGDGHRPAVPVGHQHMHRDESATTLTLNEIGRVVIRSTEPVFVDDYRRNRHTGSFILIDESSNHTVAGGMIRLTNS